MNTKNKAFRLAVRGILTAIIIVQAIVPFLGFIPIGPISLTIIHVTVIVAAITLGTKDGMFIGFIWGMCTLLRANFAPTSPIDILVFRNPIVSVLPRIIVGLVAGGLFTLIYKKTKKVSLSALIAAGVGTLTNTVLVLGSMGLLYTDAVAKTYEVATSGLAKVLAGIVVVNGVPEMILACIVTPLIVKALFAATKLSPDNRG